MPALTTFSIGESWCRRVVICPTELRADSEGSDEDGSACCSESAGSRAAKELEVKARLSTPSQSRAPKRPDQPLYMPRAARQRPSLQDLPSNLKSPAQCSRICVRASSDSRSCPETTEQSVSAASPAQEATDRATGGPESRSQVFTEEKAQKSVLRRDEGDAAMLDQAQSSFAEMRLGEDSSGAHSEDTDNVTEQIKMHLTETDFSVDLVHNDYSMYENVFFNSDDFSHVIEIYDFPSVFKTDDLLDAFTEYSGTGIRIKWVDNTHALGVFSSEAAAHNALSICHPMLKVRPLSKGSKKAQGKAARRAEFLQPVKERPRTDCAVAKRMVTRALGIRGRGRLQRY